MISLFCNKSFVDQVDSILDEILDETNKNKIMFPLNKVLQSTELTNDKDSSKIELEVPGVQKDKINIKADNVDGTQTIYISGKDRNDKSFTRKYFLHNHDINNINAELKNGILTVIISKIQQKTNTKEIEIK